MHRIHLQMFVFHMHFTAELSIYASCTFLLCLMYELLFSFSITKSMTMMMHDPMTNFSFQWFGDIFLSWELLLPNEEERNCQKAKTCSRSFFVHHLTWSMTGDKLNWNKELFRRLTRNYHNLLFFATLYFSFLARAKSIPVEHNKKSKVHGMLFYLWWNIFIVSCVCHSLGVVGSKILDKA